MVVGYGDGALALIDTASGKPTTEIHLPGHPEFFQLSTADRDLRECARRYQITVLDRSTAQQVVSWGSPDAQANFPMALDEANRPLLIVYREPALLAVFDTALRRAGDAPAGLR